MATGEEGRVKIPPDCPTRVNQWVCLCQCQQTWTKNEGARSKEEELGWRVGVVEWGKETRITVCVCP